ncbi:argonaute/piwi family protein [Paenarthrobacter sp. C1]|uniref:argonaute/piwi family protein n=1 Tax=Paenarthrobacter sp. C1 TaxID=3400220 RepID=UPI003BF5596B
MTGSKLPPYRVLDEPTLAFDSSDKNAVMVHPLRGLLRYGPYSKNVHALLGKTIRIATIGPPGAYDRIGHLFGELSQPQKAQERRDYLPDYPGMSSAFGLDIAPAAAPLHATLPADLQDLAPKKFSGESLAEALLAVLRQYAAARESFDVVAILLPSSWSSAFRDDKGFDLHHSIKVGAASFGISTQILNDEVWSYRCRASVAWRLSIALYSKYGGNPWKIAENPAMLDSAYIGLAYARRGRPEDAQYVTCCSQVFDADGGGMQFVAFDVGGGIDLRNPFLSKEQMRSVIARSLALYQRRNGGGVPRRVVIHKSSVFTEEELKGVREALFGISEVECVQVQASVPWRAVKLNSPRDPTKPGPRTSPDGYPVRRGTVVHLSTRAVLLWTGGNAPDATSGRSYFQGGNSIPGPLLLTRFAGKGSLEDTALEVLALTKMDWNNDALFDPLPVTLKYSQTLAQVIAHAPALTDHAYPYRLFM